MLRFRWITPFLIFFIALALVMVNLFFFRNKKTITVFSEKSLGQISTKHDSIRARTEMITALEHNNNRHDAYQQYLEILKSAYGSLVLFKIVATDDHIDADIEINSLLKEYYLLKNEGIEKAKELIQIIVKSHPKNMVARKEYGYLLLQKNEINNALQQFLYIHNARPDDEQVTLQIAYLYDKIKNKKLAKEFFTLLLESKNLKIHHIAITALKNLQINLAKLTPQPSLLDLFYKIKNEDPCRALQLITEIVRHDPDNAQAQAEMAYLLLSMQHQKEALPHFIHAFELNPNNSLLANEIGFIYDYMGREKEARIYFRIAAGSFDAQINQTANIALINLSGWSFKILPKPLFVDYYTEPFYLSRFNDYIFPLQRRVGAFVGDHTQLQLYGSYRETRDTNSISGIAPQIYSDNVKIWAIGTRYYPFSNIGLYGYIEYGDAYDIVYQNRKRWRDDLRGGVVIGQYWGAKPDYSKKPTLEFKTLGDFYGDVSYYSRYDDNVIGQLRIREGARIFRWKNTTLHFYVKGQYFFDTNHEFYNNIVEYGPGVAFTPFNQISFTIRAEHLFGHYIKVNSPTPNPYGSNYQTNIVLAEIYLLF